MGDKLVTEAYANQFLATAVQLSHEIHQSGDPRLVIVDTGFTTRNQIRVYLIYIVGILALFHIVNTELQGGVSPLQQPDEHIGILAVLGHPLRAHLICLQNAQFHALPVNSRAISTDHTGVI